MGEKSFFDKDRVDEGIKAVCDEMDKLCLTLVERWWVVSHIEKAARAVLGDGFDDLAAKYPDVFGGESG